MHIRLQLFCTAFRSVNWPGISLIDNCTEGAALPEMIGLRYLVKAAATKCGVALSEQASVVVTRCPRDGRAAGKRLSKKEEKHANETQLEEWRKRRRKVRASLARRRTCRRSPARIATVTATERASELHFRLCGRWFGQWRDVDDEAIEVL